MNKFKFIAEEKLKEQKIIRNCEQCQNKACRGLQMQDASGQLPRLASQYTKMLCDECDIAKSFPKTDASVCEICHKSKDSTGYRDGVKRYICDDCMNELETSCGVDQDEDYIHRMHDRMQFDSLLESADHQQALRARGNPPVARLTNREVLDEVLNNEAQV